MIRLATLGDLELVNELWLEYLLELQKQGGPIVPDRRTLELFTGIAELYITRELAGVVLLTADPGGILMWGEPAADGYPFTLKWGRTAQGWGTYVIPRARQKGISKLLRKVAVERLKEMGFNAVVGTAISDNRVGFDSGVGFGFKPFESTGVLELGE